MKCPRCYGPIPEWKEGTGVITCKWCGAKIALSADEPPHYRPGPLISQEEAQCLRGG